jgi:hypothetical protein
MTEHRFEYDQILLEECAGSSLAAFVTKNKNLGKIRDTRPRVRFDASCRTLFSQHAEHYGRQHSLEEQRYERIILNGSESTHNYTIGKTIENFVRNVVFVNEHKNDARVEVRHEVDLNRFADMDLETVLGSGEKSSHEQRWLRTWDSRKQRHRDLRSQSTTLVDDDLTLSGESLHENLDHLFPGVITPLSDVASILDAADLGLGHGSFNKMSPKSKHKKKYEILTDTYLDVPMDQQKQFQTPDVDFPEDDGALLSIKRNRDMKRNRHDPVAEKEDVSVLDANPDEDGFTTHLNWANSDNPDGVPIVHDAFDQVCPPRIVVMRVY